MAGGDIKFTSVRKDSEGNWVWRVNGAMAPPQGSNKAIMNQTEYAAFVAEYKKRTMAFAQQRWRSLVNFTGRISFIMCVLSMLPED